MIKDALRLLFLIVSYNFLLKYITEQSLLFVPLFPQDLYNFFILISFNSALYLSWLFGYKQSTVLWLSYLFFFQILGLSFVEKDYTLITQHLPSFLLTFLFIQLFESPTERRLKELLQEKEKLEKKYENNKRELKALKEKIKLSEELIELLQKEKSLLEENLSKIQQEESSKREELIKEREKLNQRIKEAEQNLAEYRDRLNRLTEANKRLFEFIELLQKQEEKSPKGELAQLRKERKKLIKEVLELRELMDTLENENSQLRKELRELRDRLERTKREKDGLELELNEIKKHLSTKEETYKEVFNLLFDNLEFEDRVLGEFLRLPADKKREFLKELLLLNMREMGERLESMKGFKNVFKLKPKGGRIYFTLGERKRWKVIGLIDSEDDKEKERYAKEVLVKYTR